MRDVVKGFRDKLAQHIGAGLTLTIEMTIDGPGKYDFACFGLDAEGKLSDDRYMVFYNQKSSPNGEIVLSQDSLKASFLVNLDALPANILKLVFTANVADTGFMAGCKSFETIAAGSLRLCLGSSDLHKEKTLRAIEIYKKDEWRLAFVGNGFAGGLPDLLKYYGGQELQEAGLAVLPTSPACQPTMPTQSVPVEGLPVGKIVLAKGQKVCLSKSLSNQIVVENGWTAENKDYDLKALVRFKDGRLVYVGAANTDESASTADGAVRHSGDVRAPGELERLFIKWHPDIASIAISSYSALENGTGSFKEYGVFVRVKNGSQVVEIPAASASDQQYGYTLCFGEIIFGPDKGEMEVINLEMYSGAHSENRVGYIGSTVVMDIGPEGELK